MQDREDREDREESVDQPDVSGGGAGQGLAWPHVTRCGEGQIKVKEANRACGLGLKEGN